MSNFTDTAAAGVQAAGGILGSAVTGIVNAHMQNQANKFNERMYEKQKQDEIDFWRMNNDYNLPSNQVARLLSAGVNPASQFGEGTFVGNSANAPSAPNPEPFQMANFNDIGKGFISASQAWLQSQLVKSQINLNDAKATEGLTHVEKLKAETKQIYETLEPTVAKLISEANLNDEHTLKLAQDIQSSTKLVNAQIEDIGSEIELRKKQGQKIDSDILLNDARIDELFTSIQYTCEQMRGLKSNNDVQILYNTYIMPFQKAFADFDLQTKSEENFQAYLQSRMLAKSVSVFEKLGYSDALAELNNLKANTAYTQHRDDNITIENWLEFFKIMSTTFVGMKMAGRKK